MGTAPSSVLVLLVAFLAALPVVAAVSSRLRLPYTVVLVVAGLAVSALPVRPQIDLDPAALVTVLLPGLVFEAAFRLDGAELRRTFPGVALLAVPGVIVVAVVVAVILHAAAGLSLAQGFVVGAIVSATDPVAVVSTMRRLRAPGRLVTLVDAESLFNDGTAALVFAIALAAIGSGPPSLLDGAIRFVAGLLISGAIGAGCGWVVSRALRLTRDHMIELTLTLLAAYGTYLVAELAHQSGIIASVVAGVVVGTWGRHGALSRRGAEMVDAVWDSLAFILTGAAFLLIGIAIPVASLGASIVTIGWGVVAVLVGRALVVYGLLGGMTAVATRLRHTPRLPIAWLHVLNWTGLRGAVATALALSIPADVPDRALLQGAVFGIVLFTLLVQGTTAGWLVRRAGQATFASPDALAVEPE